MANKILMAFQEHAQAWTRADAILEGSPNPNSRFFALQVRMLVTEFLFALTLFLASGNGGYDQVPMENTAR
jgi:hypothetical protein